MLCSHLLMIFSEYTLNTPNVLYYKSIKKERMAEEKRGVSSKLIFNACLYSILQVCVLVLLHYFSQ